MLFVLGVNGQILMHFAAFHQIEWADYVQRMRDGIAEHGPVREGVCAMTGYEGVDALVMRGVRHRRISRPVAKGPADAARVRRRLLARAGHHRPRRPGRPCGARRLLRPVRRHAGRARRLVPRRRRRDRRRTLRQLPHGQHALVRDRHGRPVRRPDRGSGLAGHRHGPRTRQPRALSAIHRARDEHVRCGLRRGAEVRPRDHGSAPLPQPELRPPGHPVNVSCQGPPLAPLPRAWAFGESIRAAADALPERIAVVGTGGISHWPATPDSGKINEAWDRDFVDRWTRNDRDALLDYDALSVYADAGQGGFEIRTFLTVSAAANGATGTVHFYAPIPIFAVGCTIATYDITT